MSSSASAAGDAEAEVRRRARQFEGAWHYLEVIASAHGIDDPLDDRVVEAYWVGNDLVDSLDPEDLLAQLRVRFRGQTSGSWTTAGRRARAHHSFHVFEVYPWVSLLGGRDDRVPMNVLEQCRIRTGEVLAVDGERVQVRSRPLTWDGASLAFGDERQETARWSDSGQGLLPQYRSATSSPCTGTGSATSSTAISVPASRRMSRCSWTPSTDRSWRQAARRARWRGPGRSDTRHGAGSPSGGPHRLSVVTG